MEQIRILIIQLKFIYKEKKKKNDISTGQIDELFLMDNIFFVFIIIIIITIIHNSVRCINKKFSFTLCVFVYKILSPG
jgi:hypothetical protein